MKVFLVIILVGVLGLGVFYAIKSNSQITNEDFGYKSCKINDDCTWVKAEACDECNCGTYINKKFKDQYLAEVEEKCKGFGGPACMVKCAATEARCVKGRCEGVLKGNI